MSQNISRSQIQTFLMEHWQLAVQEGQDRFAQEDLTTLLRIGRIKDFAQLRLISRLVSLKGTWLTKSELKNVLELFDQLFDTFEISGLPIYELTTSQPVSLLRKCLEGAGDRLAYIQIQSPD